MKNRWPIAIAMAILMFLSGSNAAAVAGNEPIGTVATGALDSPISIAVDEAGNLYIADTLNHRVQQITPSGVVSTVLGTGTSAGSGPNELDKPSSVAVDSTGNIYVADRQNHRIQKRSPNGDVSTVLGVTGIPGGSANELRSPVGVAIDNENNLYVADLYNHRVQKLTPEGLISTVSGTTGVAGGAAKQFRSPAAVAVDKDGNVYVADVYNHRIQVITSEGVASTLIGTTGESGDAYNHFRSPSGVAVDSLGNVYIADRWNHRIQRLSPSGVLTTVAGTTRVAGSGPTDLRAPSGVMVDGLDNLFIVDTNNDRVQIITADAQPPTISITSPALGAVFRPDSNPIARFACSDDGGSQVVNCEGEINGRPVSNGESVRSETSGYQSLIVTSIDGQGNRSTQSVRFRLLPPNESRTMSGNYLNSSGTAGSVARLYMAVLGRQPDDDGHRFWVENIEGGTTLLTAGALFLTGPEYRTDYAGLADDEFVETLYINVLNRPAEPIGAYYWLVQLSENLTREDVILWFSESAEFKALTQTS